MTQIINKQRLYVASIEQLIQSKKLKYTKQKDSKIAITLKGQLYVVPQNNKIVVDKDMNILLSLTENQFEQLFEYKTNDLNNCLTKKIIDKISQTQSEQTQQFAVDLIKDIFQSK